MSDAPWQDGFDDDPCAASSDNPESEPSSIVYQVNHFNLCPFCVQLKPGPVFMKHLKSNVYVTLNAIGSFQCNLCSHWLIQIIIT